LLPFGQSRDIRINPRIAVIFHAGLRQREPQRVPS
jgi:hypothetical protein